MEKLALIVEDDENSGIALERLVRSRGFIAHLIIDEEDILKRLRMHLASHSNQYYIAIVDGLNGQWYEAAKMIGGRARQGIVYSGDDWKEQAEAMGWKYYEKMFGMVDLMRTLSQEKLPQYL